MRRMTTIEATEMIETVFETGVDGVNPGLVDATIMGTEQSRAGSDVGSFLANLPHDIDPDSIEIKPDRCDEANLDGVHIIIKTED